MRVNTMNLRKNHGFGLIEVLVALAIMAVGLLAVASFQSGLIGESAENKARAEAVAIAQARIEQIRNYTNVAYDSAAFDALFTDISNGNSTQFTGSNAVFTRTETIVEPSDTKEIDVFVSWVDISGTNQQIVLSTELSWESPSLEGELDNELTAPIVRSATGRAELGDGAVLASDKDNMTEELEGLLGVIDRGDGDLRLSSGDDVVLTLKDACLLDDDGARTEVPCTDFVKISGRVFVDQTTKATNPTDVYVIASDAAFCQRYYLTDRLDELGNIIKEDVPTEIKDADISKFATEPNGDYLYYNYTCYLGGGWHGNIGLLVTAKNNSQDTVKACVGDPTSLDAFADPEIAIRRVYRGMAFKYIDDAHTQKEMNGDEVVYYTVGVADALELPDPSDDTQAPHDFVISAIDGSDGRVCVTDGIMTRADAGVNGVEFAGNPTSFYCLNQNIDYVDGLKLDALDYGVDEACPFDPSDPPNQKHTISGVIHVHADATYESIAHATTMNTSDGPLNCTMTNLGGFDGGKFTLAYECDVYQWTNPWAGYTQLNIDITEMDCTTYRHYYTAVGGDTTADRFECLPIDTGSGQASVTFAGTIPASILASGGVTIDDVNGVCNYSGTSFTCKSALIDRTATWSGVLSFNTQNTKLCVSMDSATTEPVTINDGGKNSTLSISNESVGIFKVTVTEKEAANEACR